MEGGLYLQHGSWARSSPSQGGTLLFTRLRYFDPARRRAGLPQDVAALVDSWGPDSLTLTLINISPSVARSVIVQGGAYAEHQIVSVSDGKTTTDVNGSSFPVRLAPGAGAKLTISYQGETFLVNKDRFIIGRGKQSSDLTIKDPNVSRQHAMIEFSNGQYYIVDMGSTNGVEYNGQRVQRKVISEGDSFRVCDHELKFTFS